MGLDIVGAGVDDCAFLGRVEDRARRATCRGFHDCLHRDGLVGGDRARPLFRAVPIAGLAWLLAGGLAYTLGVAFFGASRLRFSHAVWHLFVLAGSTCHYVAVMRYVLPHSNV